MASTSSMASSSSDFPSISTSTSASKEIIPYDEENTKQTQNTVSPKVNGIENGEKPTSKSLSKDPINKKPLTFLNLFKRKAKKPKPEKPIIENSPNPEEEAWKKEKEAKMKEEEHKKKGEQTKKEIEAIWISIRADLDSLGNALNWLKRHENILKEVTNKFVELEDANVKDLCEFEKAVKTLKQQISIQDRVLPKQEEALLSQLRGISTVNAQVANAVQLGKMPNLFTDSDFERTLQFRDFKARYNELNFELKLCLLCFSVFPEDVEIKRRVMVYWWIGEGIVPPRKVRPEESSNHQHWYKFDLTKINPLESDLTPGRWANFYFNVLLEMGFVESAHKKPDPKVDVCKMHPFVRSMLNRIAQKADFFEFDDDGTVNEEFSKSLRACLVNGKMLTEDNKLLERIHAVFNVDEAILDFKQNSLSNMRNANILYLGRWQNLRTHHIEIDEIFNADSCNILDGLQNIKNMKFLSLQGIPRMTELPKSILKLKNLTILDIRACHNLETIPDDIGCLVNLTHLDMSECYLLDDMPKGISLLTKLEVLGGFVVVESKNKNSCTLGDLKRFRHLRELSLYTGSGIFPTEKDLRALNQFKALSKLTIAWRRGSAQEKQPPEQKQDLKVPSKTKRPPSAPGLGKRHRVERLLTWRLTPIFPELPSQLTKLDLQCLPEVRLDWLRPEKLFGLKQLHISGGKLSDLGHFQDFDDDTKQKWEKVEELRLKYLDELEMEWGEVLELFPKLEYLEKVHCPKLSFFPCNEIGVWMKKKTIS